jgi:hypothetical protein
MAWFGRKETVTAPRRHSLSESADLQGRVLEIGSRLLAAARKHRGGFFSAGFWSDQFMARTM